MYKEIEEMMKAVCRATHFKSKGSMDLEKTAKSLVELGYGNVKKAEEEIKKLTEEADENAALAMEQKMRADKLEAQLQANIEKAYEHNTEECAACMKKMDFKKEQEVEVTKRKAVKEFAEKLKAICFQGYQVGMYILERGEIDKLFEELYGKEDT